jgi:hypothetical protein
MILLLDEINNPDLYKIDYELNHPFYDELVNIIPNNRMNDIIFPVDILLKIDPDSINSCIDQLEFLIKKNHSNITYVLNFGISSLLILCDKFSLYEYKDRILNIISSINFVNITNLIIFKSVNNDNSVSQIIRNNYINLNDRLSNNNMRVLMYNDDTDIYGEYKFIISNILKLNE